MAWIPYAAAAGASVLGGIMGNQASAAEAQKNRDFQEDMSNTSYQRAVADMKAAGINPMLSAKVGGASTPSGSVAQQHDVITPAVGSALQAYQATANVQNTQQATAIGKEQERELQLKNDAFADYLENTRASTEHLYSSADAARGQASYTRELATKVVHDIENTQADTKYKQIQIAEAEERIKNLGLSREQTAEEIKLLRVRIAGGLTANEAAELGLSFEKRYGDTMRRSETALKGSEATLANMKVPRAYEESKQYINPQGGMFSFLREWMNSISGRR